MVQISTNRASIAAFWLTIASGLVVGITWLVALPAPVVFGAAIVFLGCFVFAAVESYRSARRQGISILRAVGRMMKDAVKWLLYWMP